MKIHIQSFITTYVEKHGRGKTEERHMFLAISIKSPLNERYFDGKLVFILGQRPDTPKI